MGITRILDVIFDTRTSDYIEQCPSIETTRFTILTALRYTAKMLRYLRRANYIDVTAQNCTATPSIHNVAPVLQTSNVQRKERTWKEGPGEGVRWMKDNNDADGVVMSRVKRQHSVRYTIKMDSCLMRPWRNVPGLSSVTVVLEMNRVTRLESFFSRRRSTIGKSLVYNDRQTKACVCFHADISKCD